MSSTLLKSLNHLIVAGLLSAAAPASAQTVYVNQGSDWTANLRQDFYTRDQGSRIMPLSWMRALDAPDGTGFLDDALARYGYLPLPGRADPDLPVGFVAAGSDTNPSVGMNCAACHTREIDVNGTAYRLDGGPAIVDFQAFLKDLDDAVLAVLADGAKLTVFANKVLGSGAMQEQIAALKIELADWSFRYHTLIERSLPDPAWGPSRLDAVSMIFNRLTGLDIGDGPGHVIAENIAVADAPTRYPFLWNAARQDKTQWPGFAYNGNENLGLARNL
ncbi:MAG: di-heme-cytochrome C peroxidase, partial [Albidovulum sp.]|uniref:di-heme-cytochrome C peroxidase n=1 Tax=Albidovulum sp. TaxID=1872424 RepID=UPI003CBBC3B8